MIWSNISSDHLPFKMTKEIINLLFNTRGFLPKYYTAQVTLFLLGQFSSNVSQMSVTATPSLLLPWIKRTKWRRTTDARGWAIFLPLSPGFLAQTKQHRMLHIVVKSRDKLNILHHLITDEWREIYLFTHILTTFISKLHWTGVMYFVYCWESGV